MAAASLVALFGLVLALPIIRSNDYESTPLPTAGDAPRDSGNDDLETERPPTRSLVHGYPKTCLQPSHREKGGGLVAVYRRGSVTISTPSGDVRSTFKAKPPIAWSPSGSLIAAGPQGLFWNSTGELVYLGHLQHGMVNDIRGRWAWSPIADCGVWIGDEPRGALMVTTASPYAITRWNPGHSRKKMVHVGAGLELTKEPVESFFFSPDGRKLGLVIDDHGDRGIWVADLASNTMERIDPVSAASAVFGLLGWAPDSSKLLYWTGAGTSVTFDGARARWEGFYLKGRYMRGLIAGKFLPWRRSIIHCSNRLLGIVGSSRDITVGKRLAYLRAGWGPEFLTASQPSHFDASCSPDGGNIAAVFSPPVDYFGAAPPADLYARRIEILDSDGRRVGLIAGRPGTGDDSPDWGSAGMMFVRFSRKSVAEVWFAPDNGAPFATGLQISVPEPIYGHFGWSRYVDWSSTPPDGRPAG